MNANDDHRNRFEELLQSLKKNCMLISRTDFESIKRYLLAERSGCKDQKADVDRNLRRRCTRNGYKLISIAGVDTLCMIAKGTQDSAARVSCGEVDIKSLRKVVCKEDIFDVIASVHCSETKHSGYQATFDAITKVYAHIPRSVVKMFIESCSVCALRQVQKNVAPLKPILARSLFERMQVDLIDMTSQADNGYNYIGHVVDHFSKYHILFPLKRKEAHEVASCLMTRVFSYFGLPYILHSDKGREFVNNVIKETIRLWPGECRIVTGKARSPWVQGLVERSHQSVHSMIASKREELHVNIWSAWLPEIQFALNTRRSKNTKSTPYEVMFGQQPNKLDTFDLPVENGNCMEEDLDGLCADGPDNMDEEVDCVDVDVVVNEDVVAGVEAEQDVADVVDVDVDVDVADVVVVAGVEADQDVADVYDVDVDVADVGVVAGVDGVGVNTNINSNKYKDNSNIKNNININSNMENNSGYIESGDPACGDVGMGDGVVDIDDELPAFGLSTSRNFTPGQGSISMDDLLAETKVPVKPVELPSLVCYEESSSDEDNEGNSGVYVRKSQLHHRISDVQDLITFFHDYKKYFNKQIYPGTILPSEEDQISDYMDTYENEFDLMKPILYQSFPSLNKVTFSASNQLMLLFVDIVKKFLLYKDTGKCPDMVETSPKRAAIRSTVRKNSFSSAEKMRKDWGMKKKANVTSYNVGDRVGVAIPKKDRSKMDMLRVPAQVIRVNGSIPPRYQIACQYGLIEGFFPVSDLVTFPGLVKVDINKKISLREAARLHSPTQVDIVYCKCTTGCSTNRCICKKKSIACTSRCHKGIPCMNQSGQPDLPTYGGTLKNTHFTNTCSLDNWLAMLALISQEYKNSFNALKALSSIPLQTVLHNVDKKNFVIAKKAWAEMSGLDVKNNVNFFGSEYNLVIKHFEFMLKCQVSSTCNNDECEQKIMMKEFQNFPAVSSGCSTSVQFADCVSNWLSGELVVPCNRRYNGPLPADASLIHWDRNTLTKELHPYCNGLRTYSARNFDLDLPILLPVNVEQVQCNELQMIPDNITVSYDRSYVLVGITLHRRGGESSASHFTCILCTKDEKRYYDGLETNTFVVDDIDLSGLSLQHALYMLKG